MPVYLLYVPMTDEIMMAKSPFHALRYVQQLMDDGFRLFAFIQLVKMFGYDFNDVVRLYGQSRLDNSLDSMAPCQRAPAGAALAPDEVDA